MRAPIVAHRVSFFLVVFASVAACQRSGLSNGVSDAKFVAVMAELKRVRDVPGLDSGRRAFKRDSILQSQGLTPAQLEAAARRLAQNPARAQTVWQAVERRANDTLAAKRGDSLKTSPANIAKPK
jgi:hypothetical protein